MRPARGPILRRRQLHSFTCVSASRGRVAGPGAYQELGFHGLRVEGYNLSKRGNGEDLTVAHGLWMGIVVVQAGGEEQAAFVRPLRPPSLAAARPPGSPLGPSPDPLPTPRVHDAVPEARIVAPIAPLDHTRLRPRRPARAVLPGAWQLFANDQPTARAPGRDDGLAALDRVEGVEWWGFHGRRLACNRRHAW